MDIKQILFAIEKMWIALLFVPFIRTVKKSDDELKNEPLIFIYLYVIFFVLFTERVIFEVYLPQAKFLGSALLVSLFNNIISIYGLIKSRYWNVYLVLLALTIFEAVSLAIRISMRIYN